MPSHHPLKMGKVQDMGYYPSRNALAMDIEGACQATQAHSLLIGSKDDLLLLFFASRFDSSTRYAPQSLQ